MILESAISTIATLIAAGYAAHKIENAFLARKGYDTATSSSRTLCLPQRQPWPFPYGRLRTTGGRHRLSSTTRSPSGSIPTCSAMIPTGASACFLLPFGSLS